MLISMVLAVATAAAPATESELATCAAVMTVAYESGAEGVWNEKRAYALGAASYYIGRLEAALEANRNPMAPLTAAHLVELTYGRLKPADIESKSQPCFDAYSAALLDT
ncbi:MAG: hypothetical protein ACJ8EY_09525 [Sphingomicrobium sp.]